MIGNCIKEFFENKIDVEKAFEGYNKRISFNDEPKYRVIECLVEYKANLNKNIEVFDNISKGKFSINKKLEIISLLIFSNLDPNLVIK